MSHDNQAMTAIVEFQIRTETTTLDAWLDEWQKRADDAFEHEPETSAYEALVNTEDESRVLIFERYEHGKSSLQKHMARPAHQALEETMGARRMTKRRVLGNIGFDILNYGWWSRPESASPARRAGQPLILLSMRFAEPAHRDRFVELSGELAQYCWQAEPDTLIYSGAVAADDGKADAPLLKNDLMFVMACTDAAAVQKHAVDPEHVALGGKLAAEGLEIVSAQTMQYRTTGRGFLWR